MTELIKFLESLPIGEFVWIFGILGIIVFIIAFAFIIFIFLQLLKHHNQDSEWKN